MTPLQATVTIVGAILMVVSAVAVALLKNSKRSPEQRQAIDSGWDKLTGGLERRIISLETADNAKQQTIDKQDEQIAHQSNELADLKLTVAELRRGMLKVQALNAWLTRRVEQLIAFIVDNSLTPPDEEPRPDRPAPSPED